MLNTIIFTWKNQYDINIFNYLREIIKQQRQLKEIRLNANNVNINEVIDTLANTQRHSLVNMKLKNSNLIHNNHTVVNLFRSFHKLKILILINNWEKLTTIRSYEMITGYSEYRHPVT